MKKLKQRQSVIWQVKYGKTTVTQTTLASYCSEEVACHAAHELLELYKRGVPKEKIEELRKRHIHTTIAAPKKQRVRSASPNAGHIRKTT